MAEFTILTIYDGRLYNTCRIHDEFILLVKGILTPEIVSRLDAHIYAEYTIYRGKFNAQKTAMEYLESEGIEVIPAYMNRLDFSGDRSE